MDEATEPQSVIEQIREQCTQLARLMMTLQPLLRKLEDEATRAACVKAAYEMTVNLETVKKQLARLEKKDDSSLL